MILRTIQTSSVTVDECSRFIVTRDISAGTITLKLTGIDGQHRTIMIPNDGHTVFVMSNCGETVDRYTLRNRNGDGNGDRGKQAVSIDAREVPSAGKRHDESVSHE